VGVRPNVEWLRPSGVIIDRGVVVDEYLRTSLPDVWAAGDCAQGLERISGSRMVLATIPVASEQGLVAGRNMAGSEVRYGGGIPLNALQFGRLQVASYGYVKPSGGQETRAVLNEARRTYKKVVIEDGRIAGALFLRTIDRAGLFRYLIENRVDVSGFADRLLADDFGPSCLPADLRWAMFGTRQSRLAPPAEVTA